MVRNVAKDSLTLREILLELASSTQVRRNSAVEQLIVSIKEEDQKFLLCLKEFSSSTNVQALKTKIGSSNFAFDWNLLSETKIRWSQIVKASLKYGAIELDLAVQSQQRRLSVKLPRESPKKIRATNFINNMKRVFDEEGNELFMAENINQIFAFLCKALRLLVVCPSNGEKIDSAYSFLHSILSNESYVPLLERKSVKELVMVMLDKMSAKTRFSNPEAKLWMAMCEAAKWHNLSDVMNDFLDVIGSETDLPAYFTNYGSLPTLCKNILSGFLHMCLQYALDHHTGVAQVLGGLVESMAAVWDSKMASEVFFFFRLCQRMDLDVNSTLIELLQRKSKRYELDSGTKSHFTLMERSKHGKLLPLDYATWQYLDMISYCLLWADKSAKDVNFSIFEMYMSFFQDKEMETAVFYQGIYHMMRMRLDALPSKDLLAILNLCAGHLEANMRENLDVNLVFWCLSCLHLLVLRVSVVAKDTGVSKEEHSSRNRESAEILTRAALFSMYYLERGIKVLRDAVYDFLTVATLTDMFPEKEMHDKMLKTPIFNRKAKSPVSIGSLDFASAMQLKIGLSRKQRMVLLGHAISSVRGFLPGGIFADLAFRDGEIGAIDHTRDKMVRLAQLFRALFSPWANDADSEDITPILSRIFTDRISCCATGEKGSVVVFPNDMKRFEEMLLASSTEIRIDTHMLPRWYHCNIQAHLEQSQGQITANLSSATAPLPDEQVRDYIVNEVTDYVEERGVWEQIHLFCILAELRGENSEVLSEFQKLQVLLVDSLVVSHDTASPADTGGESATAAKPIDEIEPKKAYLILSVLQHVSTSGDPAELDSGISDATCARLLEALQALLALTEPQYLLKMCSSFFSLGMDYETSQVVSPRIFMEMAKMAIDIFSRQPNGGDLLNTVYNMLPAGDTLLYRTVFARLRILILIEIVSRQACLGQETSVETTQDVLRIALELRESLGRDNEAKTLLLCLANELSQAIRRLSDSPGRDACVELFSAVFERTRALTSLNEAVGVTMRDALLACTSGYVQFSLDGAVSDSGLDMFFMFLQAEDFYLRSKSLALLSFLFKEFSSEDEICGDIVTTLSSMVELHVLPGIFGGTDSSVTSPPSTHGTPTDAMEYVTTSFLCLSSLLQLLPRLELPILCEFVSTYARTNNPSTRGILRSMVADLSSKVHYTSPTQLLVDSCPDLLIYWLQYENLELDAFPRTLFQIDPLEQFVDECLPYLVPYAGISRNKSQDIPRFGFERLANAFHITLEELFERNFGAIFARILPLYQAHKREAEMTNALLVEVLGEKKLNILIRDTLDDILIYMLDLLRDPSQTESDVPSQFAAKLIGHFSFLEYTRGSNANDIIESFKYYSRLLECKSYADIFITPKERILGVILHLSGNVQGINRPHLKLQAFRKFKFFVNVAVNERILEPSTLSFIISSTALLLTHFRSKEVVSLLKELLAVYSRMNVAYDVDIVRSSSLKNATDIISIASELFPLVVGNTQFSEELNSLVEAVRENLKLIGMTKAANDICSFVNTEVSLDESDEKEETTAEELIREFSDILSVMEEQRVFYRSHHKFLRRYELRLIEDMNGISNGGSYLHLHSHVENIVERIVKVVSLFTKQQTTILSGQSKSLWADMHIQVVEMLASIALRVGGSRIGCFGIEDGSVGLGSSFNPGVDGIVVNTGDHPAELAKYGESSSKHPRDHFFSSIREDILLHLLRCLKSRNSNLRREAYVDLILLMKTKNGIGAYSRIVDKLACLLLSCFVQVQNHDASTSQRQVQRQRHHLMRSRVNLLRKRTQRPPEITQEELEEFATDFLNHGSHGSAWTFGGWLTRISRFLCEFLASEDFFRIISNVVDSSLLEEEFVISFLEKLFPFLVVDALTNEELSVSANLSGSGGKAADGSGRETARRSVLRLFVELFNGVLRGDAKGAAGSSRAEKRCKALVLEAIRCLQRYSLTVQVYEEDSGWKRIWTTDPLYFYGQGEDEESSERSGVGGKRKRGKRKATPKSKRSKLTALAVEGDGQQHKQPQSEAVHSIDLLAATNAAVEVGGYEMAAMFLELHVEWLMGQVTGGRNTIANVSDVVSALGAAGTAGTAGSTRRLELELDRVSTLYQGLKDPDILYGVSSLQLSAESMRRKFAKEGKWVESLVSSEVATATSAAPCPEQHIVRSLLGLGAFSAASTYIDGLLARDSSTHASTGSVGYGGKKIAAYKCRCCWKLGDWSWNAMASSSAASPGASAADPGSLDFALLQSLKALWRGYPSLVPMHTHPAKTALLADIATGARGTRLVGKLLRLVTLRDLEELSAPRENASATDSAVSIDSRGCGKEYIDYLHARATAKSIILLPESTAGKNSPVSAKQNAEEVIRVYLALCKAARRSKNDAVASMSLERIEGLEQAVESLATDEDGQIDRNLSVAWRLEKAKLVQGRGELSSCIALSDDALSICSAFSSVTNVTRARSFRLAGKWRIVNRMENYQTIMDNYLQIATDVSSLETSKSGDGPSSDRRGDACPDSGKAFLALAGFADEVLTSKLESSNIGHLRDLYGKREDRLLNLKVQLKTRIFNSNERKIVEDDIKRLVSQCKILKNEIDGEERERSTLLLLAASNYIESLKKSDKYKFRILPRLLTLWFSNMRDKRLSTLLLSNWDSVPVHVFVPYVYQIASRINIKSENDFLLILFPLVRKMALSHPHHCLWPLFALMNADKLPPNQRHKDMYYADKDKINAAMHIVEDTRPKNGAIIAEMDAIINGYVELAYMDCRQLKDAGNTKHIQITTKLKQISNLSHIPIPTTKLAVNSDGEYKNFVYVVKFHGSFSLPGGITVPKKIECLGSDGRTYSQLVKSEDDLRQDAVMQQLYSTMNHLFLMNNETRIRRLNLKGYKVLPLTPTTGVIEWVNNAIAFGGYLTRTTATSTGALIRSAHERYRRGDITHSEARKLFQSVHKGTFAQRISKYKQITRRFKPVFHHFFLERFPDPMEWFAKRNNFVRSVSSNSIAGYCIGLGDRHTMNLLIDTKSAECVHIDLGVAFDQGRQLSTPECVPFRLTRNVVDGFGVNGVEGTFRRCCEFAMAVIRNNRETLVTIAEVLVHDPLFKWSLDSMKALKSKKSRVGAFINSDIFSEDEKETNATTEGAPNADAEQTILTLRKKLTGYYEGREILSISGHVQELIKEAMNEENLARMFYGWAPWV